MILSSPMKGQLTFDLLAEKPQHKNKDLKETSIHSIENESRWIIYEQPLSELVRLCLRLEHLFNRLDVCLVSRESMKQHIQVIVSYTIDILNLLDRTDLKSKLYQEFIRLISVLKKLECLPDIDSNTLHETICKLDDLTQHFLNAHGKIGQSLRNNELLIIVRQNLLSPGGDCCIDAPAYWYWLNQPFSVQEQQINDWLKEFNEIKQASNLLLSIIRDSSVSKQYIAQKGFYHEVLDKNSPCQLLRISITRDKKIYPEVSAGKHRVTIRFLIPSDITKTMQSSDDVIFNLTKCII